MRRPASPPAYGEAPPSYGEQPPADQQASAPPAYGQPAAAQPWAGQPGMMTAEEKTWGGAAHWSALVASLVALAFLGPLIVLLVKGNESPYVRAQAVESLNFQITMAIAGIVSFILCFVLIGFILLPIVGIWWLVFTILGSVRSSNGEDVPLPRDRPPRLLTHRRPTTLNRAARGPRGPRADGLRA